MLNGGWCKRIAHGGEPREGGTRRRGEGFCAIVPCNGRAAKAQDSATQLSWSFILLLARPDLQPLYRTATHIACLACPAFGLSRRRVTHRALAAAKYAASSQFIMQGLLGADARENFAEVGSDIFDKFGSLQFKN